MEETNCVSLKLLIDTESQRVLFAEAGKEFIDFLLHILALPLGTFIPLFEKQGMLGSFGNINESIDNLRSIDDYLQPDVDKETLLKAKVDISGVPLQLEMPNVVSSATSRKLYRCPRESSRCDLQVAYDSTAICPLCQEVKPMSTTSTFTLLNKFNVKEMGALEEKVIVLGMDEVVKLLRASLQSKSVLTDVFLPILNQEVKCETF
uniref:Uncharacterized protein n=1 Tax=Quercus lobata TaxID=97700 RepID=A0A7N2MDZ8_QUELO